MKAMVFKFFIVGLRMQFNVKVCAWRMQDSEINSQHHIKKNCKCTSLLWTVLLFQIQ
jgi:hypothetical protein